MPYIFAELAKFLIWRIGQFGPCTLDNQMEVIKSKHMKCLHLSQNEVGLNIHRNKMWELLYLTIR